MANSGKEIYVQWVISSGTFDLHSAGIYRSFNPGGEMDTTDISGGGDQLRVMTPTIDNISPEMEVVVKDNGTATLDALKMGVEGSLIWGMEGTTAGRPKWGIYGVISSASDDASYDGEITRSVTWSNISSTYLYDGKTAVWA